MELVNGRPWAARSAFSPIASSTSLAQAGPKGAQTSQNGRRVEEIVVLPQLSFLQGLTRGREARSTGRGHVFVPSDDAALRAPVLVPILLGIQRQFPQEFAGLSYSVQVGRLGCPDLPCRRGLHRALFLPLRARR